MPTILGVVWFELWEISPPIFQRGTLDGIVEPFPPFDSGVAFIREKRSHIRVVGIAIAPGIAARFDGAVEFASFSQTFLDFGRNEDAGGLESFERLPAEFPGKEMITKSLFLIAAIHGELGQDLLFDDQPESTIP